MLDHLVGSDSDAGVGSVGSKGGEKNFHLGQGLGLGQDAESDDRVCWEDDLEWRMRRDAGSSSSASNPHDSG